MHCQLELGSDWVNDVEMIQKNEHPLQFNQSWTRFWHEDARSQTMCHWSAMSSSPQFYIPKDKTIKKAIKYTFVEYISGQ